MPFITAEVTRKISIHTPARGVTKKQYSKTDFENISIHTPARGVTKDMVGVGILIPDISIHTPARGVTAIFANNHI